MESSGSQCCSTKGKSCGVIFKLVLLGLLACIASSLWHIQDGINAMAAQCSAVKEK